jgi:hypothetical protein
MWNHNATISDFHGIWSILALNYICILYLISSYVLRISIILALNHESEKKHLSYWCLAGNEGMIHSH